MISPIASPINDENLDNTDWNNASNNSNEQQQFSESDISSLSSSEEQLKKPLKRKLSIDTNTETLTPLTPPKKQRISTPSITHLKEVSTNSASYTFYGDSGLISDRHWQLFTAVVVKTSQFKIVTNHLYKTTIGLLTVVAIVRAKNAKVTIYGLDKSEAIQHLLISGFVEYVSPADSHTIELGKTMWASFITPTKAKYIGQDEYTTATDVHSPPVSPYKPTNQLEMNMDNVYDNIRESIAQSLQPIKLRLDTLTSKLSEQQSVIDGLSRDVLENKKNMKELQRKLKKIKRKNIGQQNTQLPMSMMPAPVPYMPYGQPYPSQHTYYPPRY